MIHANLGAYKKLKAGVRGTKPWVVPLSAHEAREMKPTGTDFQDPNDEDEQDPDDGNDEPDDNEEVQVGRAVRPSMDVSAMKKHIGWYVISHLHRQLRSLYLYSQFCNP